MKASGGRWRGAPDGLMRLSSVCESCSRWLGLRPRLHVQALRHSCTVTTLRSCGRPWARSGCCCWRDAPIALGDQRSLVLTHNLESLGFLPPDGPLGLDEFPAALSADGRLIVCGDRIRRRCLSTTRGSMWVGLALSGEPTWNYVWPVHRFPRQHARLVAGGTDDRGPRGFVGRAVEDVAVMASGTHCRRSSWLLRHWIPPLLVEAIPRRSSAHHCGDHCQHASRSSTTRQPGLGPQLTRSG